jgi:prepilin-type N-terminal cleavage/methylation domain-containing protein
MSFFRKLSRSSMGFTLIEVMIALVILAVGLLALMTMQIVSIRANAFSSEMTYSTMLAQQQLETLRNLPFTDANLFGTTPPTPPTLHTLPLPIIDAKGGSYSVSWQVEDTTADMKTITLDVTWQSRRQGEASQTSEQQTVRTRMRTIVSQ